MITNGGNSEGLFHGAVMQSGGPIPVGDIEHGQKYYEFLVDNTGCRKYEDTLDCLRKVPYATYKKAMDASPNMFSYQVSAYIAILYCVWRIHHLTQALILAWLPRVDGVFLKELPQISALLGRVANVPMIAGAFPPLHSRWGSSSFQETVTMRVLCSRSPRRTSRKHKLYLSSLAKLIALIATLPS